MSTIKVTSYIAPSTQTAAFTFALGQEVSGVVFDSASAAIATIPLNSTVAFPVGVQIPIVGVGVGQLSIAPVSGSVTLTSADSKRKLRVTGSGATLWQTALNVWVLLGDLAA